MTLTELLGLIDRHSGIATIVIVLVLSLVEVSKIKINPWSKLFSWLGTTINKDVLSRLQKNEEELTSIKKSVSDIENRMDDDKIDGIRSEILSFATSCKKGEEHTVKQFKRIFTLHETYDAMIEEKGLENGVMEIEYAYIVRVYNKCLDNNLFLNLEEDDEEQQ